MLTQTAQMKRAVQVWKEVCGKNVKWNWEAGINKSKKKTEITAHTSAHGILTQDEPLGIITSLIVMLSFGIVYLKLGTQNTCTLNSKW